MKGIEAYDALERVRRYDADMDVMHPLRHEMLAICLQVAPWKQADPVRLLDVGTGTGFVAAAFLEELPRASVVAVDGAESMIAMARARLAAYEGRVSFLHGDFRRLEELLAGEAPFDGVVSSFALHHLTPEEKSSVLRACRERLRPGGWLLNADIVASSWEEAERRIQELRLEGIVRRAAGRDERYADLATARRTIEEMEADEGDRPLPLEQDLELLWKAGFRHVELFWKEHREYVAAAVR